jgi:hypothetical protein
MANLNYNDKKSLDLSSSDHKKKPPQVCVHIILFPKTNYNSFIDFLLHHTSGWMIFTKIPIYLINYFSLHIRWHIFVTAKRL